MESVNCPLSDHAQNIAIVSKDRSWSYAEIDALVQGISDHLRAQGLKEGDRAAFIARSTLKTVLLFFALFRLRAVACPISFRIPEAQLPNYWDALGSPKIIEPEILPLQAATAKRSPIALEQWATCLFTSGSSGNPKVACHSFGNHYWNAKGVIPLLGLDTSSRWLLSLPLFHVSGIGILLRTFLSGGGVVLEDADKPVSHLSLVPTQLYRKKPPPSVKCILLGGAPILPEMLQTPLPIIATYGMTEMSSIIALSSAKEIPYRKVKIAEDGEIHVGGESLFLGYWDGKQICPAGEWFATKDLGRWKEGRLEVVGRKDRQFISGGENIQPEEIERALCTIPGIRQAAVLPVEDAEFGCRPIAFIEDMTQRHTLESIREALRIHLPSFMHPVRIFRLPENPGIKPNPAWLSTLIYPE